MSNSQPLQDRYAQDPAPTVSSTRGVETTRMSLNLTTHDLPVALIQPDPQQLFARPGYNSPAPLHNPAATASVYVAAISALSMPFLIPISLVLGLVGWSQSSQRHGVGRKEAQRGLLLSGIMALFWTPLITIFYYGS